MLFDFKGYILEIRNKDDKKEIVEKYEKYYGPISGEITDQVWYKEYVSLFESLSYKVPEELKDDFDWNLLISLVASSYSSEGTLDNSSQPSDFLITVSSGDKVVVKKVSELRGFQILRLYEIYIEEQMNLQILIAEDDATKETEEEKNEKLAVINQREARLNRRKLVLNTIDREKLGKEAEKEKESKLEDLYGQL